MSKKYYEEAEQTALFQICAYNKLLKWLHAIPNGGKRNPREAKRLKAQGVKAGVHDCFLPKARGVYHGCYIEMKYGDNKLSDKQIEFAIEIIKEGYCSFVCYSSREAEAAIKMYLQLQPNEEIISTCPYLSINHIT